MKEDSEEEMSISDIRKKLEEMKYATESENEKEDEEYMGVPEVIPPEETWEQDYPTITLTYYAEDDVLADEQDNILDDIEQLVGVGFAQIESAGVRRGKHARYGLRHGQLGVLSHLALHGGAYLQPHGALLACL